MSTAFKMVLIAIILELCLMHNHDDLLMYKLITKHLIVTYVYCVLTSHDSRLLPSQAQWVMLYENYNSCLALHHKHHNRVSTLGWNHVEIHPPCGTLWLAPRVHPVESITSQIKSNNVLRIIIIQIYSKPIFALKDVQGALQNNKTVLNLATVVI